MTNPEIKGRRGCLVAAIVAAVLLLPPAYLLSIGPAMWLCAEGWLPPPAHRAYIVPADFVLQRCPPLNDVMRRYYALFSGFRYQR